MKIIKILPWFALIITTIVGAHETDPSFDQVAQKLVDQHYTKYKDLEYFTGLSAAIYIPGEPIRKYVVGKESRALDSKNVTENTLFQIGSISKSFTAAVVLQLEAEGKLKITDSIGNFLQQYPKWGMVTIKSLLNMTSGVPNYSDTPLWNAQEAENITRSWTDKELLAFVYPPANFNPPLRKDYFYTNSAYLLAGLIVEKVTNHNFQNEVTERLIKPLHLKNTFYPTPTISASILNRQANSYYYNQYDSPNMLGKDVTATNLSWAGAAGAIISTPEDVCKWIIKLFTDKKVLADLQRSELTALVSTNTGKPIAQLTDSDDRGFGLGVIKNRDDGSPQGSYYFYEGETLGFRALYTYTPCNNVVITAMFNSATNPNNDHASALVNRLYDLVLREHPELTCKGM